MKTTTRRPLLLASMSFLMTLAPGSEGQVTLRILEQSPIGYHYEPHFLIAEIRNDSRSTINIPVENCSGEGITLWFAPFGKEMRNASIVGCESHRLVRLESGERWLALRYLQLPVGEYEVEVSIQSLGACHSLGLDSATASIDPEESLERHDCWLGEARTLPVSLTVEEPHAEVDLAAARAFDITPWTSHRSLALNLIDLREKFPSSHYTYAAMFTTRDTVSMLEAIQAQPDNALNPWVVAEMAKSVARRNRPCGASHSRVPPDRVQEVTQAMDRFPPSRALGQYLAQVDSGFEECGSNPFLRSSP